MATTLSNEDWVIASTSYRRNGWIIDDAFADLNALQQQVAKIHGKSAAYLSPDGFLVLQINGGNLAKKLGVKSSDEVTISKK